MTDAKELPIRFRCEFCGTELEVAPDMGGQACSCPECLRIVIAPSLTSWHTADVTAIDNHAAEPAEKHVMESDMMSPAADADSNRKPSDPPSPDTVPRDTIEQTIRDQRKYIKFTCACGQRILFPVDTGRKRGRCPKCGATHRIPDEFLSRPERAKRAAPRPEPAPTPQPKPVVEIHNASYSSTEHAARKLREHLNAGTVTADPSRAEMVAAWPRADFHERAIAALIDSAVCLGVALPVLVALKLAGVGSAIRLTAVASLVMLITGIVNDAVGTAWAGGSIGKKLIGIQVRLAGSGRPVDARAALLRTLIKWPLGVLLFWIVFLDKKVKAFHDRMSNTRVMRMPKRA